MKKITEENIRISKESPKKIEELYSFDIFDTLITRKTATPTGIFALMQKELETNEKFKELPQSLIKDFFHIRINTEKYSKAIKFNNEGSKEVNIFKIYDNIQKLYCLSEEQKIKLLNLEIDIESKNIIPIHSNIERLKNLYAENKKIVLISDMYLTSELINHLLKPYIGFINDIKIYVSCEHMACKGNSRLFRIIKRELQPKKWFHIGDNKISDVEMAKKEGIQARLYNFPQLESFERTILKQHENNIDYQLIIGQSRNIKILSPRDSKTSIGISLAGPILTSYVNWVLQHCLNKKINRLYFIARDGYILKEIADILIQKNKYSITTKYIYGSRLAWRAPSIEYNKENYSDFLKVLLLNAEKLADITGISNKKLKEFIDKKYLNKKLSLEEKEILIQNLSNNRAFWDLIIEKNKKQKDLAIKYLKQEINYRDNHFAFIDLAGSGNTNNCLARMMRSFYPQKINTFYMQTNKNIATEEFVNRFCYLFAERALMWLEILSRAPHGQTLGYKKEENIIIPILENIDININKNWNYESYFNGIKTYAKYYNINVTYDLLKQYLDIIPTLDTTIIDSFSNQIFSCIGKNENQEFAPAFRKKDAINYLLFDKPLQTNAMHWSLHRTKPSIRKIIDFKNKYGSLRNFFIDIHFSNKDKEKLFYVQILGLKISLRSLIWRKK